MAEEIIKCRCKKGMRISNYKTIENGDITLFKCKTCGRSAKRTTRWKYYKSN
ncbi:MAG: hypothetical protein KAX49_13035 [Halanaerobiales bacterium]|nr:hypothetical protein [Halanaerobiales bacterium]